MVFLRIKYISGFPYLYLCESHRNGKKVSQKVVKYIGRIKSVEPLTDQLIKKIFDRDGSKCVVCGRTDKLTIDHIKPLIKNGEGFMMVYGENKEDNLQVLCETCNQIKNKK